MGVYCDVIRPLSFITFHEWNSHICTCKTIFCTLQIWTKPQVCDFHQWHYLFLEYFLCKLTFSFIQLITLNIKLEVRIHQLNEKVNSTSGFDLFSILWSDFKVNFFRYWGWTVNSAVSVYVKFNILQNGITNKMKDLTSSQILQPTNAYQSHPTFICAVKILIQNAVFYNKICNVILRNHTFWHVWNI